MTIRLVWTGISPELLFASYVVRITATFSPSNLWAGSYAADSMKVSLDVIPVMWIG